MVDLSKVSQAVQKFVDETMKSEGKKGVVDTQNEFDKLSSYLANNKENMSNDEIGYIQGLMVEYTTAKKEEQVTDYTKDSIKDIKKLMGDKKTVDTEAEAKELLRFLNNKELKPADVEFVKQIISASGYGDLLVDRVGALEARADKSDAVDKALARGLYNNTVHDMHQDERITSGARFDEAQNQAIEDIKAHDEKQDDLIAEGRARDEAQDAKIAAGQKYDRAQDAKIAAGQKHDRVQDKKIAAGQKHDRVQDKAIKDGEKHDEGQDRVIVAGIEHEIDQDRAIVAGIEHDRNQDRVIAAGIEHDMKQDARIYKVKKDLKEHEESYFQHGPVSWFE